MDDLKIVLMSGELEEQLYQYAFIRFLEVNTGQKCVVDDSCFWEENDEYHDLEIEKIFSVKLNKLSDFFSVDVWEEMIQQKKEGISIPQQLQDNGLNLMIMTDFRNYQFEGNVIYMNPKLLDKGVLDVYLQAKGVIYFCGNFYNHEFFFNVREDILHNLRFQQLRETLEKDTINALYQKIIQMMNSVAIYINAKENLIDKYKRVIQKIKQTDKEYVYFVFSNDISWCKKYSDDLGLEEIKQSIYYVEENENKEHINLQLMSMCKTMILPNNPLVMWAYYLNKESNVEFYNVME